MSGAEMPGLKIAEITLDTVTTDQCAKARAAAEAAAGDNAELTMFLSMLLVGPEGIAEGVARGVWTEVPA